MSGTSRSHVRFFPLRDCDGDQNRLCLCNKNAARPGFIAITKSSRKVRCSLMELCEINHIALYLIDGFLKSLLSLFNCYVTWSYYRRKFDIFMGTLYVFYCVYTVSRTLANWPFEEICFAFVYFIFII